MARLFQPDDEIILRICAQLAVRTVDTAGAAGLNPQLVARFVDTAFWASLEVNEGRTTHVSIAVITPELARTGAAFAEPVPCDAQQIARLAPVTPMDGCLLAVSEDDRLWLWGLGRCRPTPMDGTLVLDVWEPGIVRVGVGPYPTFAVLNGRTDAVIEGRISNLPRYLQRILKKNAAGHPPLESKAIWRECMAIAELVRLILVAGHGGIVLIVPGDSGDWSRSLNPFAYRFARPDTGIHDAIRCTLRREQDRADVMRRLFTEDSADSFERSLLGTVQPLPYDTTASLRAVASLAGADGAIVMTRDLAVLGFGAKIAVRSAALPATVLFRPAAEAGNGLPVPFENIGGTRHQSSARFVDAHRDAVALVVSQDRHLSVIHWDSDGASLCVLRNAEWWA